MFFSSNAKAEHMERVLLIEGTGMRVTGWIWICLVFWCGPNMATAGVVVTSTLGTNSNAQGKIIGKTSSDTNGAGLVFTTGSSSSWHLNNIQLMLYTGVNGGYSYSGGTVSFYLYQMGNGTIPTATNSLAYVGTTSVSLGTFKGISTKTFDLSGLSSLSAGTQYFLGINATGYVGNQNVPDDFLKISGTGSTPTAADSSGWSVSTAYSYMLANGSDSPTGTHNFSSSTTSVGYSYVPGTGLAGFGFILDATAVPEPATIVLFTGAMIIGGAGAYLKRRKQKLAIS